MGEDSKMLKPERIKEIENLLDVDDCHSPLYESITALYRRAIEDLLIERNCILLPALKDAVGDLLGTADYCCDSRTVEDLINNYCQKQWETMG